MGETDLIEIIGKLRAAGREFTTIDAKQEFKFQENGEKAEFVKDVAAMANNGQKSYIIIGLQDGSFTDVGRLSYHYLKNTLNQFLPDKIDPPVVIDYQEFTISGNEYGVIEIMGYNPPYIIARDLISDRTDRKQIRIYRGTIFIRHEDRTVGISRSELEELLKVRGLKKEFEGETEYAQQLAFERPKRWEYSLTAELLRSKLEIIRQKLTEVQKGLVYRKTVPLQGWDFIFWARSKSNDLKNLIKITMVVFTEEIPASWGPPGVAGDPLEIKRAVDKLAAICGEMVEWEAEVRQVLPPQFLESLKQKMEGWTSQMFDELNTLHQRMTEILNQPNPTAPYEIKLVFKAPTGTNEFIAEINQLVSDPEVLKRLRRNL